LISLTDFCAARTIQVKSSQVKYIYVALFTIQISAENTIKKK